MCIFKAGLSSLSDDWAKCKEKIPDVSDSNQNVETTCKSKLKFIELKDLFIKGCRKYSQRWIMYVANTAILELRIFSRRYRFRSWVFASTGENFYCLHWRVYYLRCHKVDVAKTFLHFYLFTLLMTHFTLCAHKSYVCILQIGSFNWGL